MIRTDGGGTTHLYFNPENQDFTRTTRTRARTRMSRIKYLRQLGAAKGNSGSLVWPVLGRIRRTLVDIFLTFGARVDRSVQKFAMGP